MSLQNNADESGSLMLIPINLHSEQEVAELLQQRQICGWNYLPSNTDAWREMMDNGTKTMFWIMLPSNENIRAGHISLASEATPPHPEIARLDKTIMTISTFFTMPEYRGLGLGSSAVDRLVELAKHPPYGSEHCSAIVIDTMRKAEVTDEWKALWNSKGLQAPGSGEDWYASRGFVKFHEEFRYEDSAPAVGNVRIKAAFMRRMLR